MENSKRIQDTPEKKIEMKKDRPERKTRLDKAIDSLSKIATVQGGGKK